MAKQPGNKPQLKSEKKQAPRQQISLIPLLPETLSKKIFFGFAAVLLVIMLTVSHQYGVSGDENFHRVYGHHIVDFYTRGDTTAVSQVGPDSLMIYYGGFFDGTATFAAKALPQLEEYDVRHFINALFGFVAILCAGLVAVQIAGWQAGLITLLLMAFSPRFFGESMNNPKDITMAAGYMLSYVFIIKFLQQLPKVSWKTALGLAVSIGIAMGIRIGGLLLIPYLYMFFLIWVVSAVLKHEHNTQGFWRSVGISAALATGAAVLGYGLSLLLWPYGLVDPIHHPLEALGVAEKFPVQIRILFDGQHIASTDVPSNYISLWLWVTTPLVVLLGYLASLVALPLISGIQQINRDKILLAAAGIVTLLLFWWVIKGGDKEGFTYTHLHLFCIAIFLGACSLIRERKLILIGFMFFSLYFPLSYVIAKKSVLYDGMRHFYFVYPSLVILTALTFSYIINRFNKPVKYAAVAVLLVLVALPARFMFANHPNEYVYFNELTGGIKGAYGNFETDYYMNSVKQCADWIKTHEKPEKHNGQLVTIYTNAVAPCNAYFEKDTANISVGYVSYRNRFAVNADYLILYNRFVDRELILNNCFPADSAAFTVYADGVPLCYVLKKTDKSDYLAYEALKKNDFQTAAALLEPYCAKHPKDDAALLNYARACIPPIWLANYMPQQQMNAMMEQYGNAIRSNPALMQQAEKGISALNAYLALHDDHSGELNRNNLETYYQLYIAYNLTGNVQQAQTYGGIVQRLQQPQ